MSESKAIPKHVAIIMDGNGRWAKARGLPRTAGHKEGAERVKGIVKAASDLGIKAVTFFAFSTENWSRPKQEISMLMRYLEVFLAREIKDMRKNNIRFRVIGREDPIPKRLQEKIREAQRDTQDNTGLSVVLAINYGSRQEIVDAAKKFAQDVRDGKTDIESLDTDKFNQYLYTQDLPEPDLLIRTSGQMRISNFLLWQLSYAELYFPEKYWPDFKKADLEEAVKVFQSRDRRFGGV